MVSEVTINRKVWTIEVYINRYGRKIVKAKYENMYGTLLEVRLCRMSDGVIIVYEVNNNIVDNITLSELRKAMMKLK